jgi:hypothetical protein
MGWVYPELFKRDWVVNEDLRNLLQLPYHRTTSIDLVIRMLMYLNDQECTIEPVVPQAWLHTAIEERSSHSAFCRWMEDRQIGIAYLHLDGKMKEVFKVDRMLNYFVEIELRKLRVM